MRLLLIGLIAVAGCAPSNEARLAEDVDPNEVTLPGGVTLRRVAGDVWVHTTRNADGIGANGLIVIGRTSSVLVDTGWTPAQTERLLEWAAETQFRPVRAAVVTHAHSDRIAGIEVLREQAIDVFASSVTAERARAKQLKEPNEVFEGETRVGELVLFFPGAAHAPDNIVVWVPEQKLLFGGCAIKSGDAKDLGNVEDASIQGWYHAMGKLRERFPEPKVVVPGHGKPGGVELYQRTLDLVIAHGSGI